MPEFFLPRPTLRSGLGKLKSSSSGGGAQKNDYFFHFFQSLDFVFFSSIAGVQCLFQPFRKDIQAIDCAIFIPIWGHFGWTLDSSQTDS